MAIGQNIGTTLSALLPAFFAAVAPPGSTDVPLKIGAITFGICAIAAIAAFSARETYRIHLNDLGHRDAAPYRRATTIASARRQWPAPPERLDGRAAPSADAAG